MARLFTQKGMPILNGLPPLKQARMASEESMALKYIFKNDYDEASKTVMLNGREYSYRDVPDSEDLYTYIYKCEIAKPGNVPEKPKEIDAEVAEIQKITEEQFLEWKNSRICADTTHKALTGRDIWESRRTEEPIE